MSDARGAPAALAPRPTAESSLNVFYAPDAGTVLMQTASADLPGPVFNPLTRYPTRRTSYKYAENPCAHDFERSLVQLRRGDESESLVARCRGCGTVRVKA